MHKLRKESICHPGAGEKLIFNFPNDTPSSSSFVSVSLHENSISAKCKWYSTIH